MTTTLQGRTILMSGGSRGIGLAIALRAAADGANVALLAKTDQPHPALEGTIHTAAAEIEAAAIDADCASPPMIARPATDSPRGRRLPSISATQGRARSASTARHIARCAAW